MEDREMTVQQILNEYETRYNNPCYRRADGSWMDDGNANQWNMLTAALKLSPEAQAEFVQGWNGNIEFSMDGQFYIGSAKNKFPHLIAEAPAAGIEIISR